MKKLKGILTFVFDGAMSGTMEEIGLSMIASVLRENDYEIKLMMEHVKDIDYTGIAEYKPDFIGFTVYELSKNIVSEVIKKIKRILPDTLIIIGGVYSTYNAEEYLENNPEIDFAIIGEGEVTTLELVEKLYKKKPVDSVKGLIYRKDGRLIQTENRPLINDLDTIPFAARDILVQRKMKLAVISGSRGCVAKCDYCATQLFWGNWRGRTIKNIVDEIEYLVKEYDIKAFNFIDCSFEDPFNNLERAIGLANEIIKRNLSIAYYADFRADFQRKVSHDVMELLIKSGLCAACIGIESANEDDLRFYNKIATVEDNYKIMDLFRKYDIGISPGFINFNPKSTLKSLKDNMEFLRKYGYSIKIFTRISLYKGTRMYEKVKSEGLTFKSDTEEVDYRFTDELVGKLSNYLFTIRNELDNKHNHVIKYLDHYMDFFNLLLGYYKRVFYIHQDQKALDFFKDFLMTYNEIKNDFNERFAQWINVVIERINLEWDYQNFQKCTEEIMPSDVFINTKKKLDVFKSRMYYKLMLLGYESYITSI